MIMLFDNVKFARRLFGEKSQPWPEGSHIGSISSALHPLASNIFHDSPIQITETPAPAGWQYGLIVEHASSSQYDTVCALCQENVELPDALFCFAGSGEKFHGQRDRLWAAPPGNIYLTTHFAPHMKIPGFGVGFSILAAVSVIETIDDIPGLAGRAGIKWVNDIFIGNDKVSGFLAYTQNVDGTVTASVIGIGLNVTGKPEIEPDRFVPGATTLSDQATDPTDCTQTFVLSRLLYHLHHNYDLLKIGRYLDLLDFYRQRSIILGREVEVISDPINGEAVIQARGTVKKIGNNLELFISGHDQPITRGRLILKT